MTSPGRADTTLNGWRTESYQVTSHARSGPSRLDAIPGPSRQIPQMPSPSEAVEEKVRPNPRTTPPLSMLRRPRDEPVSKPAVFEGWFRRAARYARGGSTGRTVLCSERLETSGRTAHAKEGRLNSRPSFGSPESGRQPEYRPDSPPKHSPAYPSRRMIGGVTQ
jgi:hypothetical protein